MLAYITDGNLKVYFTAIVKEAKNISGKTTTNPIESGSNVSDHYLVNPEVLKIDGRISGENADSKVDQIRQFMKNKSLLKYFGKYSFQNCLITAFPTEKVKTFGNGVSFSMTLQEMFIAQQESVEIVSDTADETTGATLQNTVNDNTQLGLVTPEPVKTEEEIQTETEIVEYFDSIGGGQTMINFFSGGGSIL